MIVCPLTPACPRRRILTSTSSCRAGLVDVHATCLDCGGVSHETFSHAELQDPDSEPTDADNRPQA